jgi:hypothetical protein
LRESHILATPPPPGRRRDLSLLHVAGFIVTHEVRERTLKEVSQGLSATKNEVAVRAVDTAIGNFMTIADQVFGGMENDEVAATVRVAIQLEERSTGDVVQHLDLFESDGACGPLQQWAQGDFGDEPVAYPSCP